MEIPADRKYSKEHVWVKAENGIAEVGITDYAQRAMKDIVFAELPEKGKAVEKGKQLCVLESVKSVNDVIAPVNGEVIEVNSELAKQPGKINQACFDVWIVKLRVKDESELRQLMDSAQYSDYVKSLE